ncbi:hypothetical protein SAMN05216480_10441 [Pustulibacterium marinum]|uniref:Fibronectin type-III domain-containing protein n=1 Tax=Pustulibacterium marinum TaxID=1224947 RepID=A0A1I7GAP7_9FLAO|nr:hypothetical protein [Pustulibacterium marinum]SFU45527.1 hypothetical protein SAMN05216480_10441 [Pustulibacterium marinum]
MAYHKVKTSYRYMKEGLLVTFSEETINQLTGNANFTFPEGMLTALTAAQEKYTLKLSQAFRGGTNNTEEKNLAKTALLDELRLAAQMVNVQANGDVEKLISSGFVMAKVKGDNNAPVPDVKNFKVKPGPNGFDLEVSVQANASVKNYLFYVGIATENQDLSSLQQYTSNKSTMIISNLQPNVRYACRACYMGTKKENNFTYSSIIYCQVLPM